MMSVSPYTSGTGVAVPYEPMISLEQAVWNWIYLGAKKHNAPLPKRLAKAFLAGLFLAFGGCLVQILGDDPWFSTNAPGLLKIIQGVCFPVGLIMIVLFQVDLVTASQAIFILSTIKRKVPIWAFLVDWTIVTVGNLAGSLLFAGFVKGGHIYSQTPAYLEAAAHVGDTKMGVGFGQILIRGIGCNMLVVIAVFQASLMRDGVSKIAAAHFPIATFVSIGFDHVVANMFIIPAALMTNMTSFNTGQYIWKSMISSFIGNTVGAAIIVLPLMLLYGGNEHDPALLDAGNASNDGIGPILSKGTANGGPSPSTTVVNGNYYPSANGAGQQQMQQQHQPQWNASSANNANAAGNMA